MAEKLSALSTLILLPLTHRVRSWCAAITVRLNAIPLLLSLPRCSRIRKRLPGTCILVPTVIAMLSVRCDSRSLMMSIAASPVRKMTRL